MTIGAMTTTRRGPVEWTFDELDALPDDGQQYELLDGLLLVTPGPVWQHQGVVLEIAVLLRNAVPPELRVFVAPLDWRPDEKTSLQPDVLVVRRDNLGERKLAEELELVVEVLSPSTRRKDQILKRSKYEDAGVPVYWIFDPEEPSLLALELGEDGRYREVARVVGAETAKLERPFPVEVAPAALLG